MRVGIHCPIDHADVSDEACLACARGCPRPASGERCNYPPELLRAMMNDKGRETAHISATMVASVCARQNWLARREPYYVNPDRMYAALRGSLGHAMLEQFPEPGAIVEQRWEMHIPGLATPVTGQIDKLSLTGNKIIDFKTKAEDKNEPKSPQSGHVTQLNIYRYLVKHGWPQQEITHDAVGTPLDRVFSPGEPAGLEITELELVYWTFGWVKRLPVKLLPDEQVREIIIKGATQHIDSGIPPIPKTMDPMGLKGTPSTFCTIWCPLRDACLTYALDEE